MFSYLEARLKAKEIKAGPALEMAETQLAGEETVLVKTAPAEADPEEAEWGLALAAQLEERA